MKIILCCLFLLVNLFAFTQEVTFKGDVYTVKKEAIFKDDVEVTSSLSLDDQKAIKAEFEKKRAALEAAKTAEDKIKEAEKAQKKIEKKHAKAEKALKQKEKAQTAFKKAEKKYDDALKKYKKLEKKGKLSPDDNHKWLEKIEKLKKDQEKAKRKLKRA